MKKRDLISVLILWVSLALATGLTAFAAAGPPPKDSQPGGLPLASGTTTPAAATSTPTATGTPVLVCPLATWQVVYTSSESLTDIAAVGPSDVWAGGTTMLHWDGTAWTAKPVATITPGNLPVVKGVAAAASNRVWAVGAMNAVIDNLAEYWDGTAWNIIPGVFPAGRRPEITSYYLTHVSAVGLNDAFVTTYDIGPPSTAGVLHCTPAGCGTVGATPKTQFDSVSTDDVWFGGLDALALDDVWVVGRDNTTAQALIWHWDGTTWTPVPPAQNATSDTLAGVAALAADDIWAVGSADDGTTTQTLVEHWNGTAWSTVPSPALSGSRSVLNDVAAVGPDDLWAVGVTGSISQPQQLIEHWNGTSWSVVPSPHQAGTLGAVAASGPNDVWAVGSDGQSHNLIEHLGAPLSFADVPAAQPFYAYTQWMACRAYVSGYTCGGPGEPCVPPANLPYFRPGAPVTRAQLLKMVVNASGWPLVNPVTATFADVPPGSPFYQFVETGAAHGLISGYACGGPGEPCDPAQRPYFRPGANITRGQLAKVITLARNFPFPPSSAPIFADVQQGNPFYGYIEAIAVQGVVSGYTCGGPGEPCDDQHRPYFRPYTSATRGQVTKFVAVAYGGP